MPMILYESLYLLKHELNIRHERWLVNDAFGRVDSGNCENSVKSCVLYECLVYLEVRETGGAAYESQNYSE